MHRHAPGELYFILEGEFTFYTGDGDAVERITVSAGEVIPLPGGTTHAVRNESEAVAVAFVVHAPGAPMESFSRAAAALSPDSAPDMQSVLEIAERYGVELMGPIPSL